MSESLVGLLSMVEPHVNCAISLNSAGLHEFLCVSAGFPWFCLNARHHMKKWFSTHGLSSKKHLAALSHDLFQNWSPIWSNFIHVRRKYFHSPPVSVIPKLPNYSRFQKINRRISACREKTRVQLVMYVYPSVNDDSYEWPFYYCNNSFMDGGPLSAK